MSNVPKSDSAAKPIQKQNLVNEEKSFFDLLTIDYLPILENSLKESTTEDIRILAQEGKMPILNIPCTMLFGEFPDSRRFWICFIDNTTKGAKVFVLANAGSEPSLVEPFLNGDGTITTPRPEASATTVSARAIQRLKNQQWLSVN
uniref:Uncharacterized protein n=1 Tax=Paulinella longichromatophora TaxID=1708747 RepID=A0A2H4ZQ77_9EUKA|nr:hypothetical protein PLO_691 [Paulinella longichromatophora]